MKHKTAISAIALTALLSVSLMGCGETPRPEKPNENGEKNMAVDKIEWLGMVTGPDSPGKTEQYGVGGTDLGFPIYNSVNDTMYLAFGDTFTNAATLSGMWRSNVLAYSKDFDLSDGLMLDGFITSKTNVAKPVIDGIHLDSYEMTKIPTGGIEIDGTMYLFYFSKYSWNNQPKYSMNYGGVVKSTDNGQSWQRVHDLSWLDDSVPERKAEIEKLANQDIDLQDTDAGIAMETHAGYSFTQTFPVDGKDGYVYIFGEGGYREGGIRLGRVKYSEFESFEAYEYFNGFDESGKPVWLKGSEGLKTVEKNRKAYAVSDHCSEQSVMYNAYLEKWMVVYLRNNREGIVYCTADNIYGPYSDAEVLIPYSYPFPNDNHAIYGGLVHEKYTEENGKIFFFLMSQWTPVYNSSLVKVVLK